MSEAVMEGNPNVHHPSHYTQGGIECIDCMKAATINKPPFEAICVSNAIKYLYRYEEKNGLEDVQKAEWYIQRLIKELQEKAMKYRLVGTESGVALETPWHTLMIPREGDMFNSNDSTRNYLLTALLQSGGFCPCQPKKDRDTMCPCKNYRADGKCICGMFVKVPQSVVNENSDKNQIVRDDPDIEEGKECEEERIFNGESVGEIPEQ